MTISQQCTFDAAIFFQMMNYLRRDENGKCGFASKKEEEDEKRLSLKQTINNIFQKRVCHKLMTHPLAFGY